MPTLPRRSPARRPAQSVTSARTSREEDRGRRMRSYLIAMGIRTVSFPLAVWAFMAGQLVLGWILLLAAVLIPSVAVGVANAVDHRGESTRQTPASPVHGLGHGTTQPTPETAKPTTRPTENIVGTVISSRVTPYRAGAAAEEPR